MTVSITKKRKFVSIILAWILFIGLDFLFHASLFSSFWNEDIPALKPLNDLALLIPAGYLSFFLLTSLVGFVFHIIFRVEPEFRRVLQFGFVFALLFSSSNFFGLYSYVDLPLKQLLVFNLVYFFEIFAVALSLYFISFAQSLKKPMLYTLMIFVLLVIMGIVIQNILPSS